jgi:hypothetical protein
MIVTETSRGSKDMHLRIINLTGLALDLLDSNRLRHFDLVIIV